MKKSLVIILSIMLILAMTLPVAAVSSIAVKSIKLDNSKVILDVGQTSNLKVTFEPANTSQTKVTYVTSNKNVATVDGSGVITGVHGGYATITVYTLNQKIFAKCNVTINQLAPVKLKWYVLEPNGVQKDNAVVADAVSKYVKDKINATLDMEYLDWSYNDKLKLITASGENFDMCFSASWWDYSVYVAKGAFMALNDIFPKYAPKTFASINPAYKKGPLVDGKLYAIPTEQNLAFSYGLLFNKKYVDKYKFDTTKIKTLKDLEPMLATIKKSEPTLVPIPGGGGVNEDLIFERLGGDNFGKTVRLKNGDTKVYNQYEYPEYVDLMKLSHSWYEKGYIEKDIATEQLVGGNDQYFKAGNWFAIESTVFPGKDGEMSASYGYPITQQILTPAYITPDDTTGSMMSISSNSKNPSRAMMLIELLHQDKYFLNLFKSGIEGVHFVRKANNIIDRKSVV
jgi:putative aldouronate transport system substrate-binding protein